MIEKFLVLLADLVTAINNNTAALTRLSAVSGAPSPEPAPTAEAPKRGRPKKDAEAPAEPQTPVAFVTPAAPPAPATPPPPTVTVQELRSAAEALLTANNNDGSPIKAINAKFGISKVSECPPEKMAAVLAELKAETERIKAKGGASDI